MSIKLLLIFLIVFALKVIFNSHYFLLARRYLKEYESYAKDEDNQGIYILENSQNIVKMLKKAGIEDHQLYRQEPTGYGQVMLTTTSIFKNLATEDQEIWNIVRQKLMEAKGVFKYRIIEAFRPIYWFEFIIYLPKIIFDYLGVKGDTIIIRIIQILWWVLSVISMIVGIFFNKHFTDWVGTF